MSRMNALIALSGQHADPLNALAQGQETRRQHDIGNVFKEHGEGIMSGDKSALNALATVDPNAALNAMQTHQSMALDEERIGIARQTAYRNAQKLALDMDAQQRQAAHDNLTRILGGAKYHYDRGDQAGFDAFLTDSGIDPAKFPFSEFPARFIVATGEADAFKAPEADYRFADGQFWDANNPQAGATGIPNFTPDQTPETVVNFNNGEMADKPELVGTKGQALVPNRETGQWEMQVLPNSELDRARKAEAKAEENATKAKTTSANIVLDEIAIAKDLISGESWASPATGLTGGVVANIDSTRAGALKNRLETIKANIGFDKLQAMRDASPTGGALGQVSEFENRLLQAVFGSLVQSQRAEDIVYNLDRLEGIYSRIINEGIGDEEARELYVAEVRREFAATPASMDFTADKAPDGLSADDADLWQYATPQERQLMWGQ